MLTPDGTLHTVRACDPLAHAVPGGFGSLGYVARLCLRLVPLPESLRNPRMASRMTLARGLDEVVDSMVAAHLAGPTMVDGVPTVTWALTNPEGLGLVFESRPCPGDTPLRPFFLHEPDSAIHQIGQATSISSAWNRLGWPVVWRLLARGEGHFVDSLDGFTFMMEGNWRTRDRLARLRLRPWLAQQSFAIPLDRGASDPSAALRRFMEDVRREVTDAGLAVDVIDLLPLPADEGLLSATRGRESTLVSIAIQGLRKRAVAPVRAVFERLSRRTGELGGRVHLTKNVFAEPELIREMYADTLPKFRAPKEQLDPCGVLRNAFFDRFFSLDDASPTHRR